MRKIIRDHIVTNNDFNATTRVGRFTDSSDQYAFLLEISLNNCTTKDKPYVSDLNQSESKKMIYRFKYTSTIDARKAGINSEFETWKKYGEA
jgi:hypothetical protein